MNNDQFDFQLRMLKGNTKPTDYKQGRDNHTWLAAIAWTIYGVYLLFTGRMDGIVTMFLYFTIGNFFASTASLLTYLPMYLLDKYHDRHHYAPLGLLTMILTPVTLIGTIVWVIYLATVILKMLNHI